MSSKETMSVKDFTGITYPTKNPEFVKLKWHDVIAGDINSGDRIVYLLGPTGCGKSEWAKQFAAESGKAFLQVSCKPGQELAQWIGSDKITTKEFRSEFPMADGKNAVIEGAAPIQTFSYGPLSFCLENPSVILIDEPNYLLPTEKAVFQEVLNNGYMTVLEANGGKGRIFHKHPDTVIVFAANPVTYTGTQIENLSFINRIHTVLEVPQWTNDEVEQLMENHVKNNNYKYDNKNLVFKYVLKTFNEIRDMLKEQDIAFEISIRQVMSILRKLVFDNNLNAVFNRAFVNGMYINNLSNESIAAVRQVIALNDGNYQNDFKEQGKQDYGKEAKTVSKNDLNLDSIEEKLLDKIDENMTDDEICKRLETSLRAKGYKMPNSKAKP
jgi:MoxR-like ATPase